MAQTNFRAQDFKKGKSVERAVSTRDRRAARVQEEPKPTTEPIVDPNNPDAVPAGTIPEVTKWVGDDKERAQRALDEENKNEKPRVGLVEELEKVLNTEDDVEESDDSDEESGE